MLTTFFAILTLILLDIILSVDNSVALAVAVRHLPKELQPKALKYGIIGAYGFRLIAFALGAWLIHLWWLKLIGAVYLLWLVYGYFVGNGDDDDSKTINSSFWKTVVQVEILDASLSFDNILASLGVSESVWVLFASTVISVLALRFVAQWFIKLLEIYPEFETVSFILIGLIGIKMAVTAFGYNINEIVFFSLMAVTFVSGFFAKKFKSQENN